MAPGITELFVNSQLHEIMLKYLCHGRMCDRFFKLALGFLAKLVEFGAGSTSGLKTKESMVVDSDVDASKVDA